MSEQAVLSQETILTASRRSYYHAPIKDFLADRNEQVLGLLSRNNEFALDLTQRDAWVAEVKILKESLALLDGHLLLEYSIPRMGKRTDAIILFTHSVVVLEFKVGESKYPAHAIDQVLDYGLDLKNFHKDSHKAPVIPILVSTEAPNVKQVLRPYADRLYNPVLANKKNLGALLCEIAMSITGPIISPGDWIASTYCPTPTIVEAAQALYRGHNVMEISRSEAGATNLTNTTRVIEEIISHSKSHSKKSICFITGVPGAGKTLAGLNIANSWHDVDNHQHAVFLSGNGPLVDVLREALARDEVLRPGVNGKKRKKKEALSKVEAFVQNVHHFRDDANASKKAPVEKVVVFDEAQRAWDFEHTVKFMRTKKHDPDFAQSEPDFLISVMDRHEDWATIICLVGEGQEINTGEAGLEEWFRVLRDSYRHWSVYVSENITTSKATALSTRRHLGAIKSLECRQELHLDVSIRSFRAEKLSAFVQALLDRDISAGRDLLRLVTESFPIVLTRDIATAKLWLREQARGSERYGLVASSEAQRLKPFGIFVKANIEPPNWFLNKKDDIRSSYYLEDIATEFQIQGLELDWTCVAWDADFRFAETGWQHWRFRGYRWESIKQGTDQRYLMNAYRVLLTRARQGMVIFIPEGDPEDHTRLPEYYDCTYTCLRHLGILEIPPITEK